MCCNPEMRYSCERALQHPWYANCFVFAFVYTYLFIINLVFLRISGNTARTKDIHGSVATHLRKSLLAKRNWRKAYNAAAAIRQLQLLRISSARISHSTQQSNSNNSQPTAMNIA